MVPFYIYKKDPGLKQWYLAPYLHLFLFLDPVRPIKSQNFSYQESRLVCTQNKRIWTTITTQQSKIRSEFIGPRNHPKTAKYEYSKNSLPGELGSLFGLLCWDRGSNALLLSTKKPTFQTTWILTYIGPSNILEGKKLRSKSKKFNFWLQNLI